MCVTGRKATQSETYILDRKWRSGLVRQDALWKTGAAVGQTVTSAVVDPTCKTLVMYRAFSNADKHVDRWSHGVILLIISHPTCCVSNVCLFSACVQYSELFKVTFFPKEVHTFQNLLEESSVFWLMPLYDPSPEPSSQPADQAPPYSAVAPPLAPPSPSGCSRTAPAVPQALLLFPHTERWKGEI